MNSVLIIDDEESIRFSFSRLLTENGFDDVVACSCIEEAEALLLKKEFNVVIIDRILANGEDGLEFSKKIKDLQPGCEVILVSAYPTFESAAKTLNYNLFAYLTKPVKKAELINTVQRANNQSCMQKELKIFDDALHVLFENSPEGVLICSEKNQVMFANKSFKKMFQLPADLKEEDYLKFLEVDGFETSPNNISEFFKASFIPETEVNINSPYKEDGIFIVSKFQCGNSLKKSVGFLISFREVTEEKEIKFRLSRIQKMETIGNLAGGIAHDFNNILHIVTGYSELTLDSLDHSSDAYGYVQEVLHAAERGRNIAEQILSFSRQKDEKIKPIKVHPLLKEMVNFLKSTIPSTISIQEKIDDSAGAVYASPVNIHQLILNLATNAQKAMSEKGGILTIGLEKETAEKNYIRIFVEDTGVGIPKSLHEKIFQLFFTTRADSGGTGLGLSVVYGIVKNLQGKISLQSEPGQGARFEVLLPVVKSLFLNKESLEKEKLLRGSETILAVDDDSSIVKIYDKMLTGLGYKVVCFTDSSEALEDFKNNNEQYDLVLTDMTMPKIRGDDLALELKSIKPEILVILATGYSEHTTENTLIEGVDSFLMKPVTRVKLASVLRETLDKRIKF